MARRTDRVIPFRQSEIDAIALPAKGHVEWWDEKTPSLAIRVSSTGFKSFVWVGRYAGEFKRVSIGPYPATTIIKARDMAKLMTAQVIAGEMPTTKAKTIRDEWTLGELFAWYLETLSKPHKRTWKWDERQFDRVLSPWRNRNVSQIERAEVQKLHLELKEARGPYAANKMLELLGHMYKEGKIHNKHKVPCDNPVTGIKRFPRVERERFLDQEELPRFLNAVESLQRQVSKDFFMLCLWTGARRGNVYSMRWDEILLQHGIWVVPAAKSKNKKTMTIPLSNAAIEILERRKDESTSEWVLPGQGPTGHYNDAKDAWKQIKKMAKLKDVRIHDLRRTLGSWMAVDTPLHTIGKQLGHSSQKSTAIYARLANQTVKTALDATTVRMTAKK